MVEDIFTVVLPDIGEGVVEGEVIEWLKKEGDDVKRDEAVVVVMTDKATVELPAPYAGIIAKHYVQPGSIAIKDKPLYDIRLSSSLLNEGASKEVKEESAKLESTIVQPTVEKTQTDSKRTSGRTLATPKLRGIAKEIEVDLSTVQGTGKNGRVLLRDLHNAQTERVSINYLQGDTDQPLQGIRGLMARRMDQTHIPQFSYFEQVEVTRLMQLKEKINVQAQSVGMKVSYMPFLIKALSLIAKRYPILNSSLDMSAGKVVLHQQCNIGVAIAGSQGLIVPVLKGVQDMDLEAIVRSFEDLRNKTQSNKLSSADMKEATLTISNFGAVGEGVWATPMITPPEVAILAVARIRKMPLAKDREVLIKDVLPLSWSFDHRVIDGELAAKISHEYCLLLQNPAGLL